MHGSGRAGARTVSCNLDFLLGGTSTQVRLGVRVERWAAPQSTVTAATAAGGAPGRPAAVAILVGNPA